MDIQKFDAINAKMNRITQELHKNVNLSEEMLTSTEEISGILESLSKKSQTSQPIEGQVIALNNDVDDEEFSVIEMANTVVDIDLMRQDFEYMRENLKQTTENTRKVLDSVTEELMFAEGESRAGLIMAFSDLNKAQLEGTKLFMQSYKEISHILLNLSKVYKESKPAQNVTNYTTNVMNVEGGGYSAADIVNRLRKKPEDT